jgi:hypothetical protein
VNQLQKPVVARGRRNRPPLRVTATLAMVGFWSPT